MKHYGDLSQHTVGIPFEDCQPLIAPTELPSHMIRPTGRWGIRSQEGSGGGWGWERVEAPNQFAHSRLQKRSWAGNIIDTPPNAKHRKVSLCPFVPPPPRGPLEGGPPPPCPLVKQPS